MTLEQLQKMSRVDLLELAKNRQVKVRTAMTKQQLVETIIQSSAELPMPEPTPPQETVEWIVQNPAESVSVPVATMTRPERDLPFSYNQTRVVLLVRDPYWLYSFWDYSAETYHGLVQLFGGWDKVPLTLRVYQVALEGGGAPERMLFDIPINHETRNWYVHVQEPDKAYRVDLGYFHPYEGFVVLAQSNIVKTPRDSVSNIVDGDWMIIEEDFRRLYRLAGWGRPGSNSAELVESLLKRLEREMGSGAVSSLSSPTRPLPKERGFWLTVDAELILYGRTEPDASLTIGGQHTVLRPDGSFTLRMALPDGTFYLPVVATSVSGDETITIAPTVERRTQHYHAKEER